MIGGKLHSYKHLQNSRQGWDHWAGTFWGFLNVSLLASGAQLGLDRLCKSSFWVGECKINTPKKYPRKQQQGSNCPFRCLDSETFSPPNMFKFLLCFFCGFHFRIVTYLFHINCNVSCQKVLETNWQRYENSSVHHLLGSPLCAIWIKK